LDISQEIWEKKYRYGEEKSYDDTVKRLVKTCANVEESEENRRDYETYFYELLRDYRFLPGGRIIAGLGTDMNQTLFNCFTLPPIEDSIDGIFEEVKLNAIIHSFGGGTGVNFSTLRPKNDKVKGKGGIASGPVSFMTVFDAETKTITTGNSRKGANMGILNVDHPDIIDFINAKHNLDTLTQFNISVGITDEFLNAVTKNEDWELKFSGKVYNKINARDLWGLILKSAYDYAEPGVINLTTINKLNNLYYCEEITATNPCSEQPLPPYGCCLLGSFNLTKFVINPFQDKAQFNYSLFKKLIEYAVRFLDNVIEISPYPTEEYRVNQQNKRREGIGIMGLGSMLAMLKLPYNSPEALEVTKEILKTLRDTAYLSSSKLAKERGSFKAFDTEKYLNSNFIKRLPDSIKDHIKTNGIRNSHLISIAPTGSISLIADNVSSGIEPIFSLSYTRKVLDKETGKFQEYEVQDYAYNLYRNYYDKKETPDYFTTTYDITPKDHIEILKLASYYTDSAVSKTVNLPRDYPFKDFDSLFMYAMKSDIKGLTVYREGSREGILLRKEDTTAKFTRPERPHRLEGFTYKIKTPKSSYYITLNHILEGNKRRPFEIFINTRDSSSIHWITALSRLISAIFMREENPSFIIDQLRTVVEPNGGYWRDGKRIPSVLSDIADILEEYLKEIGVIEGEEKTEESEEFDICPQCGHMTYTKSAGCAHCLACGYSRCE